MARESDLPVMDPAPAIRRLLEYLDGELCPDDGHWADWQIRRISGGRNNLLYRATGPAGDVAVKFTCADTRDRAGREYNALAVLRHAGLDVAPEPLLLDRTSYRQPVVVQSWLPGEAGLVPQTDDDWHGLARHLAHVHRVTPAVTDAVLPSCTIDARSPQQGKERVREQLARLPREAQLERLRALVRRLEAIEFPRWASAPVALCRLDNNIANYVRRAGAWASVDWEYSGWGDPAFDVANLITHVALMGVPNRRWDWFVSHYCALVEDETAEMRIPVYREILLVWWVARLARYLYEVPAGVDRRLAAWPEDWQADIEAKHAHYLALAESRMDCYP